MNLLPPDILFRENAAAAAARVRGSAPLTDSNEGGDVSVALKCIGAYQRWRSPDQLLSLEDEGIAAPLIAAARTLLAVGQSQQRTMGVNSQIADGLFMYAATAFAMHGNFPSAKAALSKASPEYMGETSARRLVAAICDPSRIRDFKSDERCDKRELDFYTHWNDALANAKKKSFDTTLELFNQFIISASTSDTALMLSTGVGLRQSFRLATSHLLQTSPEIPREFVDNLVASGIYTLLPPQRQLISDSGIARHGGNTLLSLPTSTGKTLIAEACMAAAVNNCDGIAVYIAPYVAIGEQVRDVLQKHMPLEFHVISMFGGFKDESATRRGNRKQVVVATPERFDAWLRGGKNVDKVHLVVFDEVHLIENDVRGARLEGLLTRLRLMQQTRENLRLLAISAVIKNADELRAWLGVDKKYFYELSWRPTARRLALWLTNNKLIWIHGSDTLTPKGSKFSTQLGSPVNVTVPRNISPTRYPPSDKVAAESAENVAAIAIDLSKRLGGAGLIICPRRSDTRVVSRTIAELLPELNDEYLKSLSNKVLLKYDWLGPLSEIILKGVAYHNATLPFDVRSDIERAVRDRKIIFVAATTTLAEGADLPFRWTLISHWLMQLSGDGTPMTSLSFRNIAGRSGRAGAYTEGDTILFENLLGSASAVGQHTQRREKIVKILTSQDKLQSAVVSAQTEVDEDRRASVESMFSAQMLAAIGENPENNNIVQNFSKATYAWFTDAGQSTTKLAEETLSAILDNSLLGGAFATMNSPVRLTNLGIAANRTGFSPNTCRKFLSFLAREEYPEDQSDLLALVLKEFNSIPEQNEYVLRKLYCAPNKTALLLESDIAEVIKAVIDKEPVRKIFDDLPKKQRSTAQEDNIERRFDDFMKVIDGPICIFLPCVLRGLNALSEFVDGVGSKVDWKALATVLDRDKT